MYAVHGELCYAEMDRSERYGRFKDVLGKGAMKTVYRAFDEFLGTEVAWNQVKLNDLLRSPEELQRLYSEIHLLKSLNHDSIMRFRASWIDVDKRTFNFISELFTSGTLREYRKRFKRVNIRAIKDWARQILEGLDYLHHHDPPVIHRDLKCDNIFVNGHLGQVKIGDLGLAAILKGSCHAHSVIGTPEFMAPELYEEDYDELVDIYSFGMCVLEMLTSEYPYSECSNPAQIYKKVTSGKLPNSFYHIEDDEARKFVGLCLEKAQNRPSARELLSDPFLLVENDEEFPASNILSKNVRTGANTQEFKKQLGVPMKHTNMTITGTINPEDSTIFFNVQIPDKDGRAQNICFQFDIMSDTPDDVATEMVKELDIKDWEPFEISDMIDKEIAALVPSWKYCISPQICQRHSFNYLDDNDDNSPHHPFYSTSSVCSSQASLPDLFFLNDSQFEQGNIFHEWYQEESKAHDDASSDSSSDSYKYSNFKYYSETGNDLVSNSHKQEQLFTCKIPKSTRFCPERSMTKNWNNYNEVRPNKKHQHKMVRTGSYMDIRSQILHRALLEDINNHRLFKTVGAVEHIGYQEPKDLFCCGSCIGAFPEKCIRKSGAEGFSSERNN